ncbi:MAG TPA: EamA family transporter [Candidatus Acidoferrum sp.]|nr:EamA family transporter [Candidatus Acidoferrum sp.]
MATGSAAAPARASDPSSAKNLVAAKSPALTFFAFLSIYLIWGSTYLAIRYAVETIPPLFTAGLRHLTAGTILLIWALAKGLRPTAKQIRASIVIGIFFFLIGHGTLHWAETRVPSGFASLIIASEPIWVFLMASAVEKKWRMNFPLAAGVVLGLAGVAILFGHGALAAGSGMLLGAVAVLIGAISWSVGIIYSRRSHLSGNPLLLSALSLLSGSVLLLTTGAVVGEARGFSFAQVTQCSWLALAYLVVFGSVIAFTAYNWLLEHYSPTFVATHTYINPIVAVFLGWWLAAEKVTINVAIAAALVILAVFLVDRGMARLESKPSNVQNV